MTNLADTLTPRQRWLIFGALGTGVFVDSLEISIVAVILPTLVTELQVGFTLVQWVVLSFTLTKTAIVLSVGRLGDMIGKKPVFLGGTVAFVVGSVLAGLAPNIELLLLFRVLQAIGGAFATALSMGILTEIFPASERGKALGVFSASVSLGGIAGPFLGGLLLDFLSWRWIFFIGIPISCVSFYLAWRYMPVSAPTGRQRFDWTGSVSLAASLLTLMLFLTFGQRAGYRSPAMMGLFVLSLLAFALFMRTERRVKDPLLNLAIFRNIQFSLNLSMRLISFIVLGGVYLLLPFYLTNVLQMEPVLVGLLLTTSWISFGVASPVAGILSDRFGYRRIAGAGLILMAFGCYAVSTLSVDTSILGYVLRVSTLGLGMGMFQSPNNSAVMGSVPRERLGVASGINVIARTLGRTSGIAALGALWASRVTAHAGPDYIGGVTEAAAAIQIAGLRDVTLAALAIVIVALILSAWGILEARAPLQRVQSGL
ncbi:MAG: MFS transporter [Caldilineaceae bacterium]|nr:MFS transporter [Caldilineaceae bacterium]